MTAPLVTVCVPTIGRLDYLPQTIASLESQTLHDLEVLVLDNASPAGAQAELSSWARRDPRVRILRVAERIPMFENFNRGFLGGAGKYVAQFHDDDEYHPRFLEAHVEALERHPSASFAASNFYFIDRSGRTLEKRRWIDRSGVWRGRRYIKTLMRTGRNPIPFPGVVFRRSALGARGIDDKITMHFGDYVILMRMAESGDVAVVSEPLVKIRRHPEQMSYSMRPDKSIALRTQVLESYCDELRARTDDPVFVSQLERYVRSNHRVGMIWAWLSARDDSEALACVEALNGSLADRMLGAVLRSADSVSLVRSQRARLLELGRRIANTVRI